ncbi:MAG: hypothetical protein QG650_240 [Patescibacteria group bacterium]|nr:hypothetical protein [Patescibacteria group bacterium]
MDDLWRKSIKSKSRFTGKYKEELEKLIDLLDRTFEEETEWGHFRIDSVMSARNNIRLRISDPEFGAELIVNCVFWYHHTDERYGYVNIDLVISGLSRKPEPRLVGKFGITDHDTIRAKVCHDLMKCVKF